MAQLHAEAQQHIARPVDELYAIITDYAGRRRQIMPPAFHDYTAEAGGNRAPTVVRWVLHVGRHRRPYEMQVSETPAEYRVVERDRNSSFTTEWHVTNVDDASRVSIASSWQQRSRGFPALFERIFAPRSLARLHAETLRRLAAEAAAPTA